MLSGLKDPRVGVEGSFRSKSVAEMDSNCSESFPLKSFIIPLKFESQSLLCPTFLRSSSTGDMTFLMSFSPMLMLRRLVLVDEDASVPARGDLPLIVRSAEVSRTALTGEDGRLSTTTMDRSSSVSASAPVSDSSSGGTWIGGSGLLISGELGAVLNTSAMGDTAGERRVRGSGGTGGGSSWRKELEYDALTGVIGEIMSMRLTHTVNSVIL